MPLLPAQAEQLAAVAEQAPYGRGTETLIDTAVRRTWQMGQIECASAGATGRRVWRPSLPAVPPAWGSASPSRPNFTRCLVYDTGSFFVSHRDTEKAAGMFATLAIVLPSIYTGGELVIGHRDREVCLDLACEDSAEVGFAAFYADCQHEVRQSPLTIHLVLIYNLIRHGPGRLSRATGLRRRAGAGRAAAGSLGQRRKRRCAGIGLVTHPARQTDSPLEHSYTPAEVGFARLKNADAATATVLVAAARRAGCELHLALLTIAESGSAEVEYPAARRDTELMPTARERTRAPVRGRRSDRALAEALRLASTRR